MSVVSILTRDSTTQSSVEFLEKLLQAVHPRAFAVRLWDGTTIAPNEGCGVRFTLVIRHPGALRRMFASPTELSLGEAYIYDDYDIEGDIEEAMRFGNVLMRKRTTRKSLELRFLLSRLPDSETPHPQRAAQMRGAIHSKERDRRAIQYHYDISNEFYALFLDKRMIYSTARFENSAEDLDTAQSHKVEGICRDLELEEGERFLDIGCGWGGLIIHAAKNFGVQALGITLSEKQAESARKKIREAGLEHRCRVEIRDYRDMTELGTFDKIASIGMVEHVGAKHLLEYFSRVWRLLRPGGSFVNSGIARSVREPARRPDSFTDVYVFPDGELEPIHELLGAAENAGFEVRSTENLGEHYGRTLRYWVQRLEIHAAEARSIAGDVAYRVWRLYMAGSAARFFAGRLHCYQTVLRKPIAGGSGTAG